MELAERKLITATRPKECTECKAPATLADVQHEQGELVIYTECISCGITYTSRFKLRRQRCV